MRDDQVIVTWDSPARRGSHDLTYGVYVTRSGQNRRKIQQVNETIVTILGKLTHLNNLNDIAIAIIINN